LIWRTGKEIVVVCCEEMLCVLNWMKKNKKEVDWAIDTVCPFCGEATVKKEGV